MTIERAFPAFKLSFDLRGTINRKSNKYKVADQDKLKSTNMFDYDQNWTYKRKTSTPIKQRLPDINKKKGSNLASKLKIINSKIPMFRKEKQGFHVGKNVNQDFYENMDRRQAEKSRPVQTMMECSVIPTNDYNRVSVNPLTNYVFPGQVVKHVSMQMTIWTNQLNRLKKKTERLREKDAELKKKYEDMKQRAKRVLSDDEENSNTDVSPTKRARLDEVTKDLQNCKIRSKVSRKPSRIPRPRNNLFSYSKARTLFDKYTTKDKMSVGKESNVSFNTSCSDFIFSFMKNGKKCTFC